MNSVFEKLRIASDVSEKNKSDELDILKPKILQAIYQICEKKRRPDNDSIYDFISRTCATNISKELVELVIEEPITQNVISSKKSIQGLHSFYKALIKVSICFNKTLNQV